MSQSLTPPKARGRPRSEAVRSAILGAASALLYEVGLRDMTIEAIAERSGVGKTTIYRWWPSKAMVALDAYLEEMRGKVAVPNTGSSREDFRRQATSVVRFYGGPEGRVFAQFIAAGQSDPAVAEAFRDRFLAQRRAGVRQIWDRGVAGGELRADIDPEVALDMIYGSVVYRLLTGRAELSAKFAHQLVDAALDGLMTRRRTPACPARVHQTDASDHEDAG